MESHDLPMHPQGHSESSQQAVCEPPLRYDDGLEAVPIEHSHDASQIEAVDEVKKEQHICAATPWVQDQETARTLPSRIQGHRRRFWIAIAIVAIVVIAAVIGGVVGGRKSAANKDKTNSSGDSGSSTSDSSGPNAKLQDSAKLSASNWTDSYGIDHKIVFLQDEFNGLFARLWDSDGKKWTTSNVTALVEDHGNSLAPAHPGTALASAALDGRDEDEDEVWFWYHTTDGEIRCAGLRNVSTGSDAWESNENMSGLTAAENSKLAATLQRCAAGGDCTDEWILVYQDPDGSIQRTSSRSWMDSQEALSAKDVVNPSPLALMPFAGRRVDQYTVVAQGTDHQIVRVALLNHTWIFGDGKLNDLENPTLSYEPQFASTKWDHSAKAMWLALQSDGKIRLWYHDEGGDGTYNEVLFTGWDGDDDLTWSSIAMDMDGSFYGITKQGVVLEFGWGLDVDEFMYKSTVWNPH